MLGHLGKLIVAKGFKRLPKVQKIAQSGNTGYKSNDASITNQFVLQFRKESHFANDRCNKRKLLAGDLFWWLKEETHNHKVVSLNLIAGYWMDIFAH